MRTFGFFIYFQVEKETEDTYTLPDGTELWLDTAIQPMYNARQYGTVYSVPEDIEKHKRFDDGVTLRKGDKIFFHHFVVEEDSKVNLFDEEVYRLPYQQIFAVERDGEVIPMNDFVFLKPERRKSSLTGFYDPNEGEYSEKVGVITSIGKIGKEQGAELGDRVLITQKPYLMKMNGEDVYRVSARNLLCVLDDEVQIGG